MSDEASDVISGPDRSAMYAVFENSPGDFAAYGVMGDKCEELGYMALAHAYRWMWKREKFPHCRERYCTMSGRPSRKVPGQFRWAWYVESERQQQTHGVLPVSTLALHSLSRLLIPGEQKVFGSHAAAVMALAGWLKRLKDAYDIEPPMKRGL